MQTGFIPGAMIGVPGGVAELDEQGKLRSHHLPLITPSAIGAEPAGVASSAIALHEKSLPHLPPETINELALVRATEAIASHIRNTPHLTSSQVEAISNLAIAALKKETNPFPQYQHLGDLGGKKSYRGTTPPINPNIGDIFEEITATGQWVMSWFWNGTYWLSTQPLFKEQSLMAINNSLVGYYEIPSNYNIFILWFKSSALLGTNNNSNSQWVFNLLCATSAAGGALMISPPVGTGASLPSTWYTSVQQLNTHINVAVTSAKAFVLQTTKNGLASAINGSMQVAYRLARI